MILVNNQLDAQFSMYVYFYSLHVSGSRVPIIRRIIASMRNLVYVTLCKWPSGMHTRHFPSGHLPSHFHTKHCMHFSPLPYVPHALL